MAAPKLPAPTVDVGAPPTQYANVRLVRGNNARPDVYVGGKPQAEDLGMIYCEPQASR